jgi:acetylornithine deacetylase/succinyl-diaminopimelate desuccinylase-like protein
MTPRLLAFLIAAALVPAGAQSFDPAKPDWTKIDLEAMRHYQALVRIDTTDPPGNETRAVAYLRGVLEAEGIPVTVAAKDPARANLIARLKGNGSKRPVIFMGHTDEVQVDPSKWTFAPFSATRQGGFVYGRGTLDDKSDLTAALMTVLLLKRSGLALNRDVIFVAEAGEEANTSVGIDYLVNQHWSDVDAEYCLAEGGSVNRRNGQARLAFAETSEKRPMPARLVVHGPAGHGSRPMQSSAIVHLAQAVAKIAAWDPPMRLNDTTRTYFEKLSAVSTPEEAARYRGLLDPKQAPAVRQYLAEHDPGRYSMLHTSVSPNILKAGYQINVIPSEAEATLDIRALPDEDIAQFRELMRKVIDDPAVEIVPMQTNGRPAAPPSSLTSDAYKSIEAAYRKIYNVATSPLMSTGATDMAFLRAKGVQCYGVGAMLDEEDAAKGFGAHSDQERLLEEALYKHAQFAWEAITGLAAKK